MKRIITALALVLAFTPIISNALSYKILATVNDESITTQQVRDRVQLVIKSSGMEDTLANRKSVTSEMAEILINEQLQKQDAKEKNIVVTPAEIQNVISDLEKRNSLKAGGFKKFMESKDISYDAMIGQIEATILWKKILGSNLKDKITVTEADIKKAKENAPKPSGKNKIDLSEIIIPIEFANEEASKELADTIVRTARSGTKTFGELALKYSAGKTAVKEGHLGWMPEEGVKEPLASLIKNTAAGKIAEPLKLESLYVIIKVNDRQSLDPIDRSTPEERAFEAKMEDAAKKYLKGLRDVAYIDKKYKDAELYKFIWE